MNNILTILLGVLLSSALLMVGVIYRMQRVKLMQKKNQQQELHHTNARLLQLSTMSPVVLYTCVASGDFRITWVSDNITSQLGYTPAEVLADPDFWHNHIHPDDRVGIFSRLTELFVQGQHSHEYRFQIKSGEYRWMLNPLRIVTNAAGVAQEIVGTLIDVTENRALQRELLQYQEKLKHKVDEQTRELVDARDVALAAERAMVAFLANMSHELRTPLHGILSYANFGRKKLQRVAIEKLGEYFHEIHDSGILLLNLVNNLLDLSKLRAGKMTYEFITVNLFDIARDIVHELHPLWQQQNMHVSVVSTNDQVYATVDTVKIGQVLRNLLINAIKFSRTHSKIIIELFTLADGTIQFTVSDEGPGVPVAELETIFLPFEQGSHTRSGAGGTGLGLPICREIIHGGHAGRIWAENQPSGGARFIVTLPPVIHQAQPLSQAQSI